MEYGKSDKIGKILRNWQSLSDQIDPDFHQLLCSHAVPGLLEEVKNQGIIKEVDKNRPPMVLLACFPRSASTYTFQVASDLFKLQKYHLWYARGMSDYNLYLPRILSALQKRVISQQHIKANYANIELIKYFDIKTIVLIRNIFDVIASKYKAEINKGEGASIMGFMIHESKRESVMDMVIDTFLPWYLDFYVSWMWYIEIREIEAVVINYSELMHNQIKYFSRISKYLNEPRTDEEIEHSIRTIVNSKNHRLSDGKRESGLSLLQDYQIEKIRALGTRYAGYYDWIDMSPLGL